MLQALERSGRAPQTTRANWCDACAIAVTLLLFAILMYGDHLPIFLHYMRCSWPVLPLSTGLLLVMLPFSAIVGKMVDNRFFRWTALVSYGLYMWHVPIFRWCNSILPLQENDPIWLAVAFFAVALVATYAVATASYLIIERPVVRWAKRREAQRASQN